MGGGIGNFGAGDKGKLTLGCPLARSALASSSSSMISASIMSSRDSTKGDICPDLSGAKSRFTSHKHEKPPASEDTGGCVPVRTTNFTN